MSDLIDPLEMTNLRSKIVRLYFRNKSAMNHIPMGIVFGQEMLWTLNLVTCLGGSSVVW